MVNRKGSAAEIIETDPETLEIIADMHVPFVDNLARMHALLVGGERYRHAMFIRAADIDHIAAVHPAEPHENVGGKVRSGDMSQVKRPVGIGQRAGY